MSQIANSYEFFPPSPPEVDTGLEYCKTNANGLLVIDAEDQKTAEHAASQFALMNSEYRDQIARALKEVRDPNALYKVIFLR